MKKLGVSIIALFACTVCLITGVAKDYTPTVEETEPIAEPMELIQVVYTEPIYIAPPVETEPDIVIDQDKLEMLACVIYQEAGSDFCCDECRRRVADVVLNRVEDSRFPNTIEDVLTAERQYGRFHWTGVVWPDRANNPGEAHAVDRAYKIAEEVLRGQHSDLYGNGYIWQAEFEQGSDVVECCGIYFGR